MPTWTTLNDADFDMTNADNWVVDSTVLASENVFEWISPSGHILRLSGTGFTYDNGVPVSGDATQLTIQFGADQVVDISSTSVPAAALFANNMADFFNGLMSGDSSFQGGNGNEIFVSTPGSDLVEARGGDDTFVWSGRGEGEYQDPETDVFRGGEGFDTLVVTPSGGTFGLWGDGNTVRYADRNNPNERDQVSASQIEAVHVQASEASTTSIAVGFEALNVDISLDLSDGDDTLIASLTDAALTVNAGDGRDLIDTGRKNDVIDAGAGNDRIDGHAGDDIIHAGSGNDTVFWNETGAEGAEGGNDMIDGGDDDDTATLRFGDAANVLTIGTDGSGDLVISKQQGDTITVRNVEQLAVRTGDNADEVTVEDDSGTSLAQPGALLVADLGNGNDTFDGSGASGNIFFIGRNGNDIATGGAGDDLLSGGADNDTLDGGAGNDALNGANGDDTLSGGTGDDSLVGGRGTDILRGGANNDVLWGGADNDTLDGGTGIDTADYSDASDAVMVKLLAGTATGGAGNDTLTAIENVDGSDFGDTLVGNLGGNLLRGFEGEDSITGAAGDDRLVGGDQNDTLGGGNDNDELFGQEGDDTLIGGFGDDMLNGGNGTDTYQIGQPGGAVQVNLLTGVTSGAAGADTLVMIENIIGSNGSDIYTGSNFGNRITGANGNDTIRGMAGADELYGQVGNDTIDGGLGDDILNGGTGNDVFIVQNGTGSDTVIGFTGGVGASDRVDLSDFTGITDFADLTANHVTQNGPHLQIMLDADDMLTLNTTTISALAADDFIFA